MMMGRAAISLSVPNAFDSFFVVVELLCLPFLDRHEVLPQCSMHILNIVSLSNMVCLTRAYLNIFILPYGFAGTLEMKIPPYSS